MERTNFEKLQVHQLAEVLADSVWKIVASWDSFAKETVGRQIVRAADSIGQTFQREAVVVVSRTIVDLCEWRETRSMKPFTGCAGVTFESC